MSYVIEKDVPIPLPRCLRKAPLRQLMESLEPGDSFFLSEERDYEFCRGARQLAKPRLYAMRKVAGGWRVWRTA